jgi:hypothetical protein
MQIGVFLGIGWVCTTRHSCPFLQDPEKPSPPNQQLVKERFFVRLSNPRSRANGAFGFETLSPPLSKLSSKNRQNRQSLRQGSGQSFDAGRLLQKPVTNGLSSQPGNWPALTR